MAFDVSAELGRVVHAKLVGPFLVIVGDTDTVVIMHDDSKGDIDGDHEMIWEREVGLYEQLSTEEALVAYVEEE